MEGGNFYDHVSDIMSHIIQHCPEESLNKLEEISYLLKMENIDMTNFLKMDALKSYAQPSDDSTKTATST